MTDDPDNPIEAGFEAADKLIHGTLIVIGVLVEALGEHELQIKDDFLEKLQKFWDEMSPEEREQPMSSPLRTMLNFFQSPDQDMRRLLH